MSQTRQWVKEFTSGAAAGQDFTVTDVVGLGAVLPDWFELPNGGTLVFIDGDGNAQTLSSLAANSRYPVRIRKITSCTGTIRVGTAGAAPLTSVGSVGPAGPNWNMTAVKTAGYTAVLGDFVLMDTTAGALTATLPTAVGGAGQRIAVKDATRQAATHAITIAVTGGQTIDGTTPATISVAGAVRVFVSDGANWYVGN